VWERLAKRLIFAENVRQAHQLAQTGNADASLVALSLVIGTSSSFSEVDPTLHAPLDQALVGCGRWGPSAAARAFARFLQSEEARAILRRHGFLLPGEALPPR
jgi:molybdate transport system substrate-binding protein